jgi:hypothetical protein
MLGLLWLVYLIFFSDNSWDPDFEDQEAIFVFVNWAHREDLWHL